METFYICKKLFSMIQLDELKRIVVEQQDIFKSDKGEITRTALEEVSYIDNFALIVSGIRRCGKSTLLKLLLNQSIDSLTFVNFDDPRLFDFEISDFQKLDMIISEKKSQILVFDEIQVVKGWERYVRQKLEQEYKVYITGSNASLLSRELGTSLTGRHVNYELFPFSFVEFCKLMGFENNKESIEQYLVLGGFPEYLKSKNPEILRALMDDILTRDVAVRFNIRDLRSLRRLTIYLMSNIGNLTSASKLKEPSGISSVTTILEYISYLEQCYLFSFVPKFDYSVKKQSVNPKKIYAVDLGLVNCNVTKLTADTGHKLENMVYCEIRRKYKDICYHKGKGECDFVVLENESVISAIQVCMSLDADNRTREINGLLEALNTYNLEEGYIVTMDQTDFFEIDGKSIKVIPIFEFCRSDKYIM